MKMQTKHLCAPVAVFLVVALFFPCVVIKSVYGYDPVENELLDSFVYHVKPKNVRTKCMDVLNAYMSDGSEVWLYDLNNNAACQEWRFIKVNDGTGNIVYKIQDCNSGKCLSIANDSSAANAGVEIRSYTGSTGQLFKIELNNDKTFRILTKCSGYSKAIYYTYRMTSGGIDYYKLEQYYYLSQDNTCRWYIENASNDRADAGLGVYDGLYLLNCSTLDKVAYYETDSYVKLSAYSNLNVNPTMLFRYYGGGYYIIKCGYKYLTASSSSGDNQTVYWSTSLSANSNQLWEVTYNASSNDYKIRSKNLVDAGVSYYLKRGSMFQSYKLCQGSGSSTNKWKLIVDEIKKADLLMVGIVDSDHQNHSRWMGDVAADCYNNGQNASMFLYQEDYDIFGDSIALTDEITSSGAKVVIIRGHGDGSRSGTLMYLSDVSDSNTDEVTLNSTDLENCDFSDVEVILYIGCKTAAGYSNTSDCSNLLNESVDSAGCMIAVGFTENIDCDHANNMALYFMKNYYLRMNSLYSNYNTISPLEQNNARINCYEYAINEAASDSYLTSKCVYYYSGSFYTCN